jgi:hypothetical protein
MDKKTQQTLFLGIALISFIIIIYLLYNWFNKSGYENLEEENKYYDDDDKYVDEPQPHNNYEMDRDDKARIPDDMTTNEAKDKDMYIAPYNKNVLPRAQQSNTFEYANIQMEKESKKYTDYSPCYTKDVVKPGELLPEDDPYNKWNEVAPKTPGSLEGKNLLNAGHHYGVSSGVTKNANYSIRPDPLIPKADEDNIPFGFGTIQRDDRDGVEIRRNKE